MSRLVNDETTGRGELENVGGVVDHGGSGGKYVDDADKLVDGDETTGRGELENVGGVVGNGEKRTCFPTILKADKLDSDRSQQQDTTVSGITLVFLLVPVSIMI
jgi:hypothetical protein